MPLVRPVQVAVSDVTVQVAPVGVELTVYELGVPPEVGALQVIVAWPLPAVAVGVPGTPGAASGSVVMLALAEDEVEVPIELVALTVNVYAVLGFKPEINIGLLDPLAVCPPGVAVTV